MGIAAKVKDRTEKLFNNRIFLFLLAMAGSFVWASQCSISLFYRGYTQTDSSVFRYVAYAMSNGQIPYRDTFDHKGPLLYLINYLGLNIHPQLGVWILELITIFVTTVFIYKCAKQVCGNPLLATAAAFISLSLLNVYFQWGNFTEEYAMPFIAVAIYIFNEYFLKNQVSAYKLIVCGLCGGCVLMLRPNMAVAWLVFPIFVLINELKQKEYMRLLKYGAWFALGVAAAIVPFVVFFACNNALSDFWNVYIKFNMQYTDDATLESFFQAVRYFLSPVLVIGLVASFALMLAKKFELLSVAHFCFILLSLCALSMSGRMYGHYGMIIIPTLAYPFGAWFSLRRKGDWFVRVTVSALVTVIWINSWMIPSIDCVKSVRGGVYVSSYEKIDSVVSFIKDNTDEDDKILVVGNSNEIYLLSDRMSASKYSYQLPIANVDENIYNEFYAEISSNNPKAIIVYEELDGMSEFLDAYGYDSVYLNPTFNVYMQS